MTDTELGAEGVTLTGQENVKKESGSLRGTMWRKEDKLGGWEFYRKLGLMYWESKLDGQLEAQTRRENGVWECLGAKKQCHGKGDDKLLITDKWENRRDGERDRKAVSGIFRSSSQEGSSKNCEWFFWILIKCDLIN